MTPKGLFIKDVRKMFGILDPPPSPRPHFGHICSVINPRNLPYYVCFWDNPPPLVQTITTLQLISDIFIRGI